MIINDEPWKIDVDLIGTKEYYRKNDDCLDKEVNSNFINILSKQQMEFFENLGVDIEKIKVDCHHLEEDSSSNDTEKKFMRLHFWSVENYCLLFRFRQKFTVVRKLLGKIY